MEQRQETRVKKAKIKVSKKIDSNLLDHHKHNNYNIKSYYTQSNSKTNPNKIEKIDITLNKNIFMLFCCIFLRSKTDD